MALEARKALNALQNTLHGNHHSNTPTTAFQSRNWPIHELLLGHIAEKALNVKYGNICFRRERY
jgi:hypothetical protein